MISTQTYAANFTDQKSFLILINRAGGVTHQQGLGLLRTVLGRQFPTLSAYDANSLISLRNSQLDQYTSVFDVFVVLAVLIAAIGIVNTLALSIIERTREVGMLRAIGLSRAQARSVVRWEALLIVLLALLLGVAMGIALGLAAVRGLAFIGVGHVAIPWGNLPVYVLGMIVVGLIAAVLPAHRASRIEILDAIASE